MYWYVLLFKRFKQERKIKNQVNEVVTKRGLRGKIIWKKKIKKEFG